MIFIRSFQPSDKAAILEISKHTWGGYDQLPYELDRLFTNPNSKLYVMEYKNRIVAFANLNVIDDGKTGWMEHMRVHWRYRKRGFAWAMTKRLISEAETLGIERLRLATTAENEATRRITSRIGMHQVLQMKLFLKGNFHGIRWKDVSVPIVPCTPDEAYTFSKVHPNLVPKGIIIDYWHAFDLTKTVIESLGKGSQFWKSEKNCKCVSLSFGYLRSFRDAPLWCSTIYALDEQSFYSALSLHIQSAKKGQAQGFLCFHSTPYQAAHEIPGLKRNTYSSMFVLLEKCRPFVNIVK
jgi:RimJ/RimL family protein N-acetyltransferase